MRFVVVGAGAIGGTIGARLHQAGEQVVLIARGEHGAALARDGLHFVAPDGEFRLRIPCAEHPSEVEWRDGDVALLAVKSQQTVAALDALAEAGAEVPVICAQNGVANERMALRRLPDVYGMVVNLPALHLDPGVVVTHGGGTGGILDVGRFPSGSDRCAVAIAEAMTHAGFSSRADDRVMRWKYAKLLGNLGNALQAAVVPEGGEGFDEDAVEVLRALRREALACYAAAGIECADRDAVRDRHENTYRMADIPGWPRGGGSSWQSVQRGTGNIETDYLNGEITLLGGLHDVPTPANRMCQLLARRMVRERLPVGSFSGREVRALIDAAEAAGGRDGA